MKINPNIQHKDRLRLEQLIKDNIKAFAKSDDDIRDFQRFTYPLELIDPFYQPVFKRQFEMSDEKKGYLAKWVARMKAAGIIERCP